MRDRPGKEVCIHEARDDVCANLLRLKLQAEGIPARIEQESLGMMVMGFPAAFAAPRLLVPAELERAALAVLAEVARTQRQLRARPSADAEPDGPTPSGE